MPGSSDYSLAFYCTFTVTLNRPRIQHIFYDLCNLLPPGGADYGIDFGNLFLYLIPVPLSKTPAYNKSLKFVILKACHFQNGIYALLLGVMYEAARVNNDHVRFIFIIGYFITRISHYREHMLTVHKVFVAAERDVKQFH